MKNNVLCPKCGWSGEETRENVYHEGCPNCLPTTVPLKPTPPKEGYDLPLWEQGGRYRATAHAYMKREGVSLIHNSNGHTYTIEEMERAILGLNHKKP